MNTKSNILIIEHDCSLRKLDNNLPESAAIKETPKASTANNILLTILTFID